MRRERACGAGVVEEYLQTHFPEAEMCDNKKNSKISSLNRASDWSVASDISQLEKKDSHNPARNSFKFSDWG